MNFNISFLGAFSVFFSYLLIMFVYEIFRPSPIVKIGNKEIYKYPFSDFSVWFVALILEVLVLTKRILVFDVRGFMFLIIIVFVLYNFIFRLKYRVIVQDNKVSYGAFGKLQDFYLSDIADASIHSSGRRNWLVITLRYGGEVRFSSYLSGFRELCERMKSAAKKQ